MSPDLYGIAWFHAIVRLVQVTEAQTRTRVHVGAQSWLASTASTCGCAASLHSLLYDFLGALLLVMLSTARTLHHMNQLVCHRQYANSDESCWYLFRPYSTSSGCFSGARGHGACHQHASTPLWSSAREAVWQLQRTSPRQAHGPHEITLATASSTAPGSCQEPYPVCPMATARRRRAQQPPSLSRRARGTQTVRMGHLKLPQHIQVSVKRGRRVGAHLDLRYHWA